MPAVGPVVCKGKQIDSEIRAKYLFERAQLTELEGELNRRFSDDDKDVRARFKQGMLAAARSEFAQAGKCFAYACEYDWNKEIAKNNLAVIYFKNRQPEIAIKIFMEVAESERPPPAAHFNLAIIADRIAEFGGDPPPELIRIGFLESEHKPATKAWDFFHKALGTAPDSFDQWEAGLDGALYLRPEEVAPSLGFPISIGRDALEEGHRYLFDGIAALDRHDWCAAIRNLDR